MKSIAKAGSSSSSLSFFDLHRVRLRNVGALTTPTINLPRLTYQACLGRGLGRETRLPQGKPELGLWVSYLLPTTTRSPPLTHRLLLTRRPSLTRHRAPSLT